MEKIKNGKKTKIVTLYEEYIRGQKQEKEETQKLLIFKIHDEWFALDVKSVIEVIRTPSYAPLPNVPDYILGVFNMRGNITSITDLAVIFGSERHEINENCHLVVIESDKISTGILVDDVCEIKDIPVSKIEKTISSLQNKKGVGFDGQFLDGKKLVAQLNIKSLIDTTKLKIENVDYS